MDDVVWNLHAQEAKQTLNTGRTESLLSTLTHRTVYNLI